MRKTGLLRWTQSILFGTLLAFVSGCGQAPAPDTTRREEPRPSKASENPSTPSADRYDLERDEERGGHTVKKHVGRTDRQLEERLQREHNISAASTWTDLDTAETTVAAALRAERGRIEKWTRRGYPRANLALHYDAKRIIGRSLRPGDSNTVDCTAAVVVLRADRADSFYVLTTYPEARE